MAPSNHLPKPIAEPDPERPEPPGEDLGEEEWFAAWTPVLERRLEELRSGAVQGMTLEELEARIADRRAARHAARKQREP